MQYYQNNTPQADDEPELDPNMPIEEKRGHLVEMIRSMDRATRIIFVKEAIKTMRISGVPGDKEFAAQLQLEFLGGLSDKDLLQ